MFLSSCPTLHGMAKLPLLAFVRRDYRPVIRSVQHASTTSTSRQCCFTPLSPGLTAALLLLPLTLTRPLLALAPPRKLLLLPVSSTCCCPQLLIALNLSRIYLCFEPPSQIETPPPTCPASSSRIVQPQYTVPHSSTTRPRNEASLLFPFHDHSGCS
ncbi:hypothetical protein GWK47_014568 [Chionoecetes opilio]|uniref:Uncharacterized protein n=1 Tax=Chionoecetes opilio TaxID=41210 RepID=A0A8J4Y3K6_CHIOP|nr:hypothetical protein GWK47_014568 [Chionoecetes opilio]